MKWIYVIGRGHSGTTFLDIVLGNSHAIHSYGEIISGIDRLEDNCSCGAVMKDCPFWRSIIIKLSKDENWLSEIKYLKKKSHIRYWAELLFFGRYLKGMRRLSSINSQLYNAIISTQASSWVLDSSKEPTRGLFILSMSADSKSIHLVRDPILVAISYKKRFIEHGYFKFLRKKYYGKKYFFLFAIVIGLSWTFGNLIVELNRLKFPKRIIRIRHEDLLNDYSTTIRKIGKFIKEDLDDVIRINEIGNSYDIGHNIGGNNIRNKKKIHLEKTENQKKTVNLTIVEKLIIKVTSFPMRIWYKY